MSETIVRTTAPKTRAKRARLSRERVLQAATQLLETHSLESFTLAKLAQQLKAGVMSIYTYFPSRDELLVAVAETLFRELPSPPLTGTWQQRVLARLWDTQRLLERHPVVLKVIFWEGQHAAFFVRDWWMPIASLLREQGLSARETAFAMNWFATSSLGMIASQLESPQRREDMGLGFLSGMSLAAQRDAADIWLNLREVERDTVLAFGFQQLIQGLETLIEQARHTTGDN